MSAMHLQGQNRAMWPEKLGDKNIILLAKGKIRYLLDATEMFY